MARAMWTGSISFGLVNIPVRLYTATDSHQLDFHQFDSKTHKRIRYRRVIEGTDREVPYQQIVDGYEIAKGKIVTLTDEEMAAAAPQQSRTLDLEEFVPLEAIDPISWNHTYYVGPDGPAAQKAYAVLRAAMKQMKRVGIGRFVLRSKQYLATLRPLDRGLALETMFFEDEIRDLADVPGADGHTTVSAREIDMAKKLIEGLSGEWRHGKYKDTYRDDLLSLIKRKAKGEAIEVDEGASEGGSGNGAGKVIDLMEALKQSLQKGPGGGGASGKETATSATRRPSKRSGAHRSGPASKSRSSSARAARGSARQTRSQTRPQTRPKARASR